MDFFDCQGTFLKDGIACSWMMSQFNQVSKIFKKRQQGRKEKNIEMKYRNKFFYKLVCLGSD